MINNPLLNGIFFSCDMIQFTIKDFNDHYFLDYGINLSWDLDFDNSNNAYCELFDQFFTYRKTKSQNSSDLLIFTTSIDNIPIDCFAIIKGGQEIFKNDKSKVKSRVVFYSSFFILEKMNKLNFTISDFFSFLFPQTSKLYRIDICLDIPTTIKELQESVFSETKFFSQIGEDKKHPEFSQTYYIKNPKVTDNRSYIIRIYDKVLDTFKKKKYFLYPHLKKNSDVRRIELEMRVKECELYCEYPITDFLENKNKILQKIFSKYINKNISPDYHLNYGNITCDKHYNNTKDLRQQFLELGHIPNDYLSRAHGYIKNIQTNIGYFGLFDMLLKIEKQTIETIGNTTTPYQMEVMKKHGYNIKRKIGLKNQKIFNIYDLIENLLGYHNSYSLSQRKLQQILFKYIEKKPIIKLKN